MSVHRAVNPKMSRIVTDVAQVMSHAGDASPSPFAPTRAISVTVQSMLWGRAAGRCEFAGCNKRVSMSDVTLEDANMAEKAHIRAFSAGGPRADPMYPPTQLNELDNLMLLCHGCHHVIDQAGGSERYTVERLRAMKQQHEERIDLVTSIVPGMRSHVVTYGATVGDHATAPAFANAPAALFPQRIPAARQMVVLGAQGTTHRDRDADFWMRERAQLDQQFERRVRQPLQDGVIEHVSVFAIAPQPLLVELGVLLGDITAVDVYQRHRSSASWTWPDTADVLRFVTPEPVGQGRLPVLVLSLSAEIANDRITQVLGDDVTIWSVTVPAPGNEIVKSRATLRAFHDTVQPLMTAIHMRHGITTPIHIFPCMPVSLAVELGRARMPKADAPWVIYDQHSAQGGFVHALTITGEA